MTRKEHFDELESGSVNTNHAQINENMDFPAEWGSSDTILSTAPTTDYYTTSTGGIVINPTEPIRLKTATVEAETAGTLTVDIHTFVEGEGGVGYPNDGDVARYYFDVDAGENTITYNHEFSPNSYDGYVFVFYNSDVAVGEDENHGVSLPIDKPYGTVTNGSGNSGITAYEYLPCHYNLQIEYEQSTSPLSQTDDGSGGPFVSESVDRSNNTYHISDTSTDDLGSDLQSVVDQANPRDVIRIGAGEYESTSTCVIDKTLHIIGDGHPQYASTPSVEVHLQNDDTPLIRVDNRRPSISGIGMSCERSGAVTNGMVFHSRVALAHCAAEAFSNVPFLFHQAENNDNLNASRTENIHGHSIDADLIKIQNTTGNNPDLNACQMHVGSYTGDSSGFAINSGYCFGNTYYVDYCEGGGPIAGALRIANNSNKGYIGYMESCESCVTFDGAHYNYVEIGYTYSIANDEVTRLNSDGDNNNTVARRNKTDVADGTNWYRSEQIGGQDLLFTEAGRGPVVKSPDGTVAKRITIDNSGNLTTDDLDASQF